MAMNKQRRTSNINNIVRYDTSGNVSLPAGLTVEGLDAGFVKSDANGLFSIDTSGYITLSSLLTGYVVGANADISATDTVLQAFGKLQGQIDNIPSVNIYNSNGTLTGDRTINTGGFDLIFNGTDTAIAGSAKFIQMTPTLVASANSNTLIGLDVNPTFSVGSYTSVGKWGTRTRSLWINHDTWNGANVTPALYIGDTSAAAFHVQPGIATSGGTTELFMRGNNPGLGLWYFTLQADYNVTFNAGPYVDNMYFNMGGSNAMTIKGTRNIIIGGTDDQGYKLNVRGTLRTQSTLSIADSSIEFGNSSGDRFMKSSVNDIKFYIGNTQYGDFGSTLSWASKISVGLVNSMWMQTSLTNSFGSGVGAEFFILPQVNHLPTYGVLGIGDSGYGGGDSVSSWFMYPGKNTTTNAFGNIYLAHDGTNVRGNVAIGSSATPAYKLTVTGAGGFTGDASNNAIYISIGKRIFFNNREVAIGELTSAGYEAVAIGWNINSANGGNILIGKNLSGGTSPNVIMLTNYDSGTLTATSGGTLNIGSSNVSGVAIFGATSGAGNNKEVAIYGTTSGAGIEGNIAIGRESQATGPYAIALGAFAIAGTSEFVAGCRDKPVSNVYFGSGNQSTSIGAGVGNPYTINGSGAFGTDFAGGNITIAGGKGTGTGSPGDVIFSTSTPTASGTTLQTLTNRVWIKGENGNVGIGASPNSSYKLDVAGLGRFTNGLYVYSTSDAFLYFQKNTIDKWRMGNADVSDSNYFQLYDVVASKERIRWNTAGTATFTSDITVVGNSNAPFTVQATQPTFLVEAIGATNGVNIQLKPSGGQNATIQNTGGSAIEFYTGSTIGIAATITASKNVLIGSSSEGTGRLQVSNTSGDNHLLVWGATAPSIRIDNAVSGSSQRLVIGLSTASSNFITTSVAGDICITTQSSNPLLFGANATEAMRISTAARVLVGKTLDGGQRFQVNGTVNFTGLPTSSSGLASGDLWNNGGVLSIV